MINNLSQHWVPWNNYRGRWRFAETNRNCNRRVSMLHIVAEYSKFAHGNLHYLFRMLFIIHVTRSPSVVLGFQVKITWQVDDGTNGPDSRELASITMENFKESFRGKEQIIFFNFNLRYFEIYDKLSME